MTGTTKGMRCEWLPFVSWVLILKLSNHILKGNISNYCTPDWKKEVSMADNSPSLLVRAIFQSKPGVEQILVSWNCLPREWGFVLPLKEFYCQPGTHDVPFTSQIFKCFLNEEGRQLQLSLSYFANKMLTFSYAVDNTSHLTGGLFLSLDYSELELLEKYLRSEQNCQVKAIFFPLDLNTAKE